jgi:hypothetical protein
MDTLIIFAIAGCLFSAAVVYVVQDYRRHGERQDALDNVLSVKAEVLKIKKTLLGYTKYMDYLAPAKQAVSEKAKSLVVKIVREQVHVENIKSDPERPKPDVTVIFKYLVEYTIGFDLKPDSFDIVSTTSGIEIKVGKPSNVSTPFIRTHSHEISSGGSLPDEVSVLKEIQDKLPALASEHGVAIASEASIRALCEKKLIELLGSFLTVQTGVSQVPGIFVIYR